MTQNRLRPDDNVQVQMYLGDKETYVFRGTGFHTVDEAVEAAYEASDSQVNKQDYVYRVTNFADGTSARYRFNAHDNLKILPELR